MFCLREKGVWEGNRESNALADCFKGEIGVAQVMGDEGDCEI